MNDKDRNIFYLEQAQMYLKKVFDYFESLDKSVSYSAEYFNAYESTETALASCEDAISFCKSAKW